MPGASAASKVLRLSSKVALPAVAACGWLLRRLAGPVLATTTFLVTSTACAFLPATATYTLGAVCLVSSRQKQLRPRALAALASPLRPLRGHVMALGCMRLVLPPLLPGVWRALQYWQRSLPILMGYLRTSARARRLQRQGLGQEALQLWAEQHQRGADQVFDMLADVKGFYLKLAQILATKTEMLPPVYTSSLARLMDRLPPAPWHKVKRTLEKELQKRLETVFESIDEFPLASATVAQVHAAVLAQPDHPPVAVKAQHAGVRRTMKADLANMRLFVELCDMAHIDLGFDLGSVVREYQLAVPMEFRFDKEAEAMMSVRESLRHRAANDLPALRHVLIPAVYPSLSTSQVLVMQRLEGVPLLHACTLEGHIKHSLMHALVMAYGVQILSDGLFHTDPHGGNLMACTDEIGDVAVGLIDFGQVKRLTNAERLRYARLVLALASRDGARVRAMCTQLGIRIEKCGQDFEEIAAYILFDTRMDLPEALQSPMDPSAHEGWRTARVPRLPRDLFMIMRVITLLRGVLASLEVHDISSAILWTPLAEKVIAQLDPKPSSPGPASIVANSTTPPVRQRSKCEARLAMQSHLLDELEIRPTSGQLIGTHPAMWLEAEMSVQGSQMAHAQADPSQGAAVAFDEAWHELTASDVATHAFHGALLQGDDSDELWRVGPVSLSHYIVSQDASGAMSVRGEPDEATEIQGQPHGHFDDKVWLDAPLPSDCLEEGVFFEE